MITDDTASRQPGTASSHTGYSRRTFLTLAASGLVAACAPARTASGSHTVTPTPGPRIPTAPIAAENVGRLTRLAQFAPRDGRLRGIAWSPDGRVVAAGSTTVYTWDVVTGRQLGAWGGHTDQVNWLAWSAVTGQLASASSDGTIRIWDPSNGSTVHLLQGKVQVLSVDWSPDGTRLAAGTWVGTVELWDGRTGQHLATWSGPPKDPLPRDPYAVWDVAWAPDGRTIVSNRYDTHVLLWDATSGRLLASLRPDSQPNGLAWIPDGSGFVSSDDAGTIQIWDAHPPYANTHTLPAHKGVGWSYPLAWKQDGTLLACGTDIGLMQIWDMRTRTEIAPVQAHKSPIWGVAWSRDGLRLATASDDGTVRLWGVG